MDVCSGSWAFSNSVTSSAAAAAPVFAHQYKNLDLWLQPAQHNIKLV
jgi:hypothetical protein